METNESGARFNVQGPFGNLHNRAGVTLSLSMDVCLLLKQDPTRPRRNRAVHRGSQFAKNESVAKQGIKKPRFPTNLDLFADSGDFRLHFPAFSGYPESPPSDDCSQKPAVLISQKPW